MSTENETNTKGVKRRPASEQRHDEKATVLIDYNGFVGRATTDLGALSNQRATPHRLSPLMLFWPENGTPDLHLQPGLNIVQASLWTLYTKHLNDGQGLPQLTEKIGKGYVSEITGLPNGVRDVLSLVDRSIDHDALRWIEAQEMAGDQRPEVLDAVRDRLSKARPIKLRTMVYQGRIPNVRGSDLPQPVAAMG